MKTDNSSKKTKTNYKIFRIKEKNFYSGDTPTPNIECSNLRVVLTILISRPYEPEDLCKGNCLVANGYETHTHTLEIRNTEIRIGWSYGGTGRGSRVGVLFVYWSVVVSVGETGNVIPDRVPGGVSCPP